MAKITYNNNNIQIDGTLKISRLNIPTSSNSTTLNAGTSGQVLTTNGTSVYWSTPPIPTSLDGYTSYAQSFGNLQNSLIYKDGETNTYKRTNLQTLLDSVIKPNMPVDSTLNDSSTNPVQNKAIKAYVDDLVGDIETLLQSI